MKKYLLGTLALLLTFSLFAFNVISNNKGNTAEKKAVIDYSFRYDLDELAGAKSASNYTQIMGGNAPTCTGGDDLPCRLNFSSSESNPVTALQNHLNSFTDEEAVAASAIQKKAAE